MSDTYDEDNYAISPIEKFFVYTNVRSNYDWACPQLSVKEWFNLIEDKNIHMHVKEYGDTESAALSYKVTIGPPIKDGFDNLTLKAEPLHVIKTNLIRISGGPSTKEQFCSLRDDLKERIYLRPHKLERTWANVYAGYTSNGKSEEVKRIEQIICRLDNPDFSLLEDDKVDDVIGILNSYSAFHQDNIECIRVAAVFIAMLHEYEWYSTC